MSDQRRRFPGLAPRIGGERGRLAHTLNPKPQTLNPKPQTLNRKP